MPVPPDRLCRSLHWRPERARRPRQHRHRRQGRIRSPNCGRIEFAARDLVPPTGSTVHISVRRDRVHLAKRTGGDGADSVNAVIGKVREIEYQGTWVKVTLEGAGDEDFVVNLPDRDFLADPVAAAGPTPRDRTDWWRCAARECWVRGYAAIASRLKAASEASTCARSTPLAITIRRVCGAPSGQAARWVGVDRSPQPRQFAVTIAVRSWWLSDLRKGRTH